MADPTPQAFWSSSEQKELEARLPFYFGYTVAVISNPNSKTGIEFGSGVKMRIDKHLFVITAKHCFSDSSHSVKQVLIVESNQNNIKLNGPPTEVLKAEGHPTLDIGFFEIKDDGSKSAATIDHISDEPPKTQPEQTPAGPTLTYFNIVGHPLFDDLNLPLEQYLLGQSSAGQPPSNLAKRCILTPCLSVSDDLYTFAYPEKNVVTIDKKTLGALPSAFAKTPHGFSGGGIWCGRRVKSTNEVITPDKMVLLFAIQYAWRPDLRGTNKMSLLSKY